MKKNWAESIRNPIQAFALIMSLLALILTMVTGCEVRPLPFPRLPPPPWVFEHSHEPGYWEWDHECHGKKCWKWHHDEGWHNHHHGWGDED